MAVLYDDGGRVLPAYAGMIRGAGHGDAGQDRAPRVCGDDPCLASLKIFSKMCSPRMRG